MNKCIIYEYHRTLHKPVCFDSESGSDKEADGVPTGLLVITYTLADFCAMPTSTELLEDNSQISSEFFCVVNLGCFFQLVSLLQAQFFSLHYIAYIEHCTCPTCI